MALRRVYVFSRQPVPSVGERFVGVRGVAVSFRSPLCGGSVALWGGAAGCADHQLRYPNRGGLGCCLCLGGLSSESLPPEIITAKREMYLCYVREEDGDFC